MKRRYWMGGAAAAVISPFGKAEEPEASLRIFLDPDQPAKSEGRFTNGKELKFHVGLGKKGTLPKGSVFRPGFSLLGEFEINAILTADSFAMSEELIKQSGKSRDWLARHLFANMSQIDFDGDGEGGEYGDAFVGLKPLDSKKQQPFHFGEYKGVFRWYSYALHGTQDQARVGKCITGGCINVGKSDLAKILTGIALGDRVEIYS